MARRILHPIDLRTQEERRGLTSSQRNIQAITSILQMLGQAEKIRRERETLDRVATAIAGGASTIEAIANIAQQQPQFGTGIQGILQKVAGAFQPQGGGGARQDILKTIIGQRLQQALKPKFDEPSGEFAPGTVTQTSPTGEVDVLQQPAKAGAAQEPFQQTKAETARNRDIRILTNRGAKGNLKAPKIQQKAARRRLRQNPSLQDIVSGQADYTENLKGKPKVKIGIFDKAFGEEAYNQALQEVKDIGLTEGAIEASVEADFNAWWDRQATEERTRGDRFFEFVPRENFKGKGKSTTPTIPKEITDTDVRLQPAPDARLDEFWDGLSDEEKKEILQRLDEDPKNIDQILRILQSG